MPVTFLIFFFDSLQLLYFILFFYCSGFCHTLASHLSFCSLDVSIFSFLWDVILRNLCLPYSDWDAEISTWLNFTKALTLKVIVNNEKSFSFSFLLSFNFLPFFVSPIFWTDEAFNAQKFKTWWYHGRWQNRKLLQLVYPLKQLLSWQKLSQSIISELWRWVKCLQQTGWCLVKEMAG